MATNGLESLEVLCALLKQSELIKTRKWHLKTYKNCFSGFISFQCLFFSFSINNQIGAEAVDWMMLHMGLKSRQLVCNLGSRLVAKELIYCISKGSLFILSLLYLFANVVIDKNEFRDTLHSFYQFTLKAEDILSRVLPVSPILPKSTIELTLISVDPKEIARQLTLIGILFHY